MSGVPSCAMMLPSSYSTIEWITLWGWTSTWILEGSVSKSHRASMTSSPLLTRVEESIVILGPIAQVGCLRASAGVTFNRSDAFFPRKGPPDAVSHILARGLPDSPFRDWKIALCSLSTGRIGTPFSAASGMMMWPAVTSVSLLASAIFFPDSIAATVGLTPTIPMIPVTKYSYPSMEATSRMPSMPARTSTSRSLTLTLRSFAASSSYITALRGLNSRICASMRSTLARAQRAVISMSPCSLATSSVCLPIEPVEPKTAIFFTMYLP